MDSAGCGSAELLAGQAGTYEISRNNMVTPAFGDYRRALGAFGAKVLECPADLGALSGRLVETSLLRRGNDSTGLLLNNPPQS